MDHTNYARWATVHVMDMLTLEEQHPTLYNEFIQGGFTVQKTDRLFSNIRGSSAWTGKCEDKKGLVVPLDYSKMNNPFEDG